jgi:hypothetical protein
MFGSHSLEPSLQDTRCITWLVVYWLGCGCNSNFRIQSPVRSIEKEKLVNASVKASKSSTVSRRSKTCDDPAATLTAAGRGILVVVACDRQ